jgi:hypothetical protein
MVGLIDRSPCTFDHFSQKLRGKRTESIVIDMRDPLYHLIDWTWRTTPGFKHLAEDTKACVSLLLFNALLVVVAVLVMVYIP